MYAAFPRSEYYQRIRLHTAASAFLRSKSISSGILDPLRARTKTTVDLPGPLMLPSPNVPCSLTPPQSPATSPLTVCLLVPASHYDAVGLRIKYLTRLNRFTFVTARSSLCLRLARFVTSSDPRLDSR